MTDLSLRRVPDPPFEELADHIVARRGLPEHTDPGRAREDAEAMVERLRERTSALNVFENGQQVGRVWLVEQGDDRAVLRLALGDPQRAADVRSLVEDAARVGGARRLTIFVYPGDQVTEAFVADDRFETVAVQMRLDLGRDLPGEEVVVLEPMDAAAFDLWETGEIESYAAARAKSGENPDQALKVSREQHAMLLPNGLATKDHRFFVGRVAGAQVGTLWIGTERPMAFVYDVVVNEVHRRKGYGAGLMRAGALFAQQQGSLALGLNVFGHNLAARSLYESLGFETVALCQGKQL